jgi:hypothetical protein
MYYGVTEVFEGHLLHGHSLFVFLALQPIAVVFSQPSSGL